MIKRIMILNWKYKANLEYYLIRKYQVVGMKIVKGS